MAHRLKIKIVFLVLLLLGTYPPAKAFSEPMSEVVVFKWNYKDFCNKTVPGYIDAYSDGDKEFISVALSKSESFKGLNPFQKKSFVDLVQYYYDNFKSRKKNVDEIKNQCLEDLNSALESVSYKQYYFCSDVSIEAIKILGKDDLSTDEKRILQGRFYYDCIRKINSRRGYSDKKNEAGN